MKKVAILQSNYLPWKGYFDIINDVDLFVFYDEVQYTKRDWRNRNKIKTNSISEWISVPVNGDRCKKIFEVEINDSKWQIKHWKTLKHNYGRTKNFMKYKEFFEEIYTARKWENLSELNQYLIKHISYKFLGIKTEFADSRDFFSEGCKHEKLLSLVKSTGATEYISGPAAKNYLVIADYIATGINVVWKDYSGYPEYSQQGSVFEHGVSIVDLLFNVGEDAPYYIWGWRNK